MSRQLGFLPGVKSLACAQVLLMALMGSATAFAQVPAESTASTSTAAQLLPPTDTARPASSANSAPSEAPASGNTSNTPVTAASDSQLMVSAEQQPASSSTPEVSALTREVEASQTDQAADDAVEELSDDGGKVNIYGFADFTYTQLLSDRSAFNATTHPYGSFYVGNLNIYLNSDLGHKWRSLAEFRLTYLPDGVGKTTSDSAGNSVYDRTSTAYPDYTDFNRNTKVGGVIIERAWVEYAAHPLVTIRGGQWLTPYGIWNVEHGSTVIIGTTRPFVIGSELFPNHQTGLEFYGSYAIDSTQVGYHLTLSNGRGPIDAYKDLDKNKALGWRLWVQQDTDFGTFVLGTSGYRGRYTDRSQSTSVVDGTTVNSYPIKSEYNELSLAADLKWTWKGAVVQSEAIMRDVAYGDVRTASAATEAPLGWVPDNRTYGFYAIAGYRLPWFGIMPYYGGEYYYLNKTSSTLVPAATALWGGVNIRPTDRVVLKIQETHAVFPLGMMGRKTPPALNVIIFQVAWSF